VRWCATRRRRGRGAARRRRPERHRGPDGAAAQGSRSVSRGAHADRHEMAARDVAVCGGRPVAAERRGRRPLRRHPFRGGRESGDGELKRVRERGKAYAAVLPARGRRGEGVPAVRAVLRAAEACLGIGGGAPPGLTVLGGLLRAAGVHRPGPRSRGTPLRCPRPTSAHGSSGTCGSWQPAACPWALSAPAGGSFRAPGARALDGHGARSDPGSTPPYRGNGRHRARSRPARKVARAKGASNPPSPAPPLPPAGSLVQRRQLCLEGREVGRVDIRPSGGADAPGRRPLQERCLEPRLVLREGCLEVVPRVV